MSKFYALFRVIAVLFCLSLGQNGNSQTYCTTSLYGPSGCNFIGAGDYIKSFSTTGGVTNITNLNTFCSNTSTAYTYYSAMNHTGAAGAVVNFTIVNNPNYAEQFKIWVDWNNDGDFVDAGENVFTSGTISVNGSATGSFTIPATATAGTKRLRVRCADPLFIPAAGMTACSQESYGECEDYNLIVQVNQPCSGTPTVAATSSAYNICTSPPVPNGNAANAVLTAVPGTAALGYSYQWQSSPACVYNFTNITGATNATYTVTSLTAATHYRVILTCNNSGGAATSNILALYPACYCSSNATSTAGADIGNFQFATTGYPAFNNPVVPTGIYTSNPASNATYTNFTSAGPINMVPGSNSSFTISQINSGATQLASYLKIYVDFNRNGVFTDAGETVFQGAGSTTPGFATFTGFLPVPAGLTPGMTRMRIVLVQGGNVNTVTSCGTYTNGETEDYSVFIRPVITPLTATSNGPLCTGATLQLNANTSNSCATFSWTGPNGFTSALQNPSITNVSSLHAGVYTVVVNSLGITATASNTVVVNPTITTSATDSICAGSALSFGPQTITSPGVYVQAFSTATGCDSTVTLTVNVNPVPVPPAVVSPVVYCQNSTATQLTANGTALQWSATLNGASLPGAPTPVTNIAGSTKYYVSQTLNGCTSAKDSILIVVNPTPFISFTSLLHPTTCGGTNGSITIGGLMNNLPYTIDYLKDGVQQPSLNLNATFSGNLTIPGLSQGIYSGITVTLNNCISNTIGQFVLTDPLPPVVPVITGATTLCAGETMTFNASSTAGSSYTWIGPSSYAASGSAVTIAGIQVANGGVYSVTATLNGCVSPAATATLTVNPLPVISLGQVISPATCSGLQGSITVSGLIPGTGYSITYIKNGTTIGPAPVTAGVAGNIVLTGLGAGSYSGISVSLNGCNSLPLSTVVLTDPAIPMPPLVTVNSPVCQGSDINLTATSSVTGSYSWTGPGSYASSSQNPTLTNAQA
ncbi:MAG: hypothetical protein EOP49_11590, partial [Sphingobacteriales bacterium]